MFRSAHSGRKSASSATDNDGIKFRLLPFPSRLS